ncbi:TMEM175 family protein [Kribbella sp. NPDC051587]|uniref:TMEM175 family protein n=1 Tax=Kribbella sp. NPDC051587 TaxID=3364119 RepID=UPI00379A2623
MSKTRNPDRLILFTDAVVAIALTLLILPLVEVVAEYKAEDHTALQVITDHKPEIYSFLLSFAVIGNFWLGHHQVFEHVRAYTSGMMRLNMLWLLFIVILPFPTEIVGSFESSQFTAGFYSGTILALSTSQTALTWMIKGHPEIENPNDPVTSRELTNSFVLTGLTLLAFVLAAFVPGVRFYALLLLLLSPFLMRGIDLVRKRSS